MVLVENSTRQSVRAREATVKKEGDLRDEQRRGRGWKEKTWQSWCLRLFAPQQCLDTDWSATWTSIISMVRLISSWALTCCSRLIDDATLDDDYDDEDGMTDTQRGAPHLSPCSTSASFLPSTAGISISSSPGTPGTRGDLPYHQQGDQERRLGIFLRY